MERARLAPVSLLGGLACGVGAVAVYQWTAGLALAVVVTLLTLVATPAGWATRLPFALGDAVAVGLSSVPRPEGDYLISSSSAGYAVLGLALLVLVVSLGTLPRPGRRPLPGSGSGSGPGAGSGSGPHSAPAPDQTAGDTPPGERSGPGPE